MDYIIHILPNMFSGLGVSAKIFVLTFVLALPIGILLAMVRISHVALFRKLAAIYIYVMRGTPLMLQIMFIYYGLPLMLHVQVSDFPAAILAFVANYAAYFAEIFRGGIQSISKGQYEGAKVLGFSYRQTMWHIILPQVIKRVIPPLGNETITLSEGYLPGIHPGHERPHARDPCFCTAGFRHHSIPGGSGILPCMHRRADKNPGLCGKTVCSV